MNETIVNLKLDALEPHPANRKTGGFDPAKLEQLADSIRSVGVQQPIVVRWVADGRYQIVAGERRWRASKLAGTLTIPCVVRELDDVTALKIQTIENLQREDIHPLDEADGYARLIDEASYDVERIAGELGKSVSYIYQRLKLRDLIESARKMFVDGTITAGHAILLARLRVQDQRELVTYLVQQRQWDRDIPSVRDLDARIRNDILLDLARVQWKRSDPDLVPAAGACTTCPKRTAAQSELFADVCKEKRDYCLDAVCFRAKSDAFLAAQKKKLAPEKPVLLVSDHANYQEEQRAPKNALRRYTYTECKASDENAVRALVVTGPDRGRATYIRKPGTKAPRKADPQAAQQRAEEKKRKRENAARWQVYAAVVAAAEQKAQQHELPRAVLDFVAAGYLGHLWQDHAKLILRDLGWDEKARSHAKEIAKLSYSEALVLLVRCALVGHVNVGPYSLEETKPLFEIAALLGVDAKRIQSEALERLRAADEPKRKGKKS